MRSLQYSFVALAILLFSSCTAPEQQLLDTFFTAVQGGDEEALARVSLASFTGGAESWEIVEMGEESLEPFGLPELNEKLMKKRSEVRIENQKNANYAGDNRGLFEEYKKKKAEDPEYEFSGELAEFDVEWKARMETQGVLEKQAAALAEEADAMKSAAGLSLNTSINERFNGDVKAKDLRLTVSDGSGEKSYKFTLRRYELVDTERNLTPIARWIITDIEEA